MRKPKTCADRKLTVSCALALAGGLAMFLEP